jgi:futalosine hydrolase
MRILVVAATAAEITPLTERLDYRRDEGPRLKVYSRRGHEVDVLTTGVGMVATSAWCSRTLARERYDLCLNLGICGSFDRGLAPLTVVHVVSDRIAELGAEDGEAFLTAEELNLLAADEFPFRNGRLANTRPPINRALGLLPAVDGVTVNTVHGNDRSIAELTRRFKPDVESMEGAAFMYACLIQELVFAQVRAVSNIVERRNRSGWKISEAVQRLGETALDILDDA